MNRIWGFIKCLLNPRACRRTDKLMCQYVEGELDEATREKLEHHLSDCPVCLQYVNTYRRVIFLTRQHGTPSREMPPVLAAKLREFISQNPQLQ